MTTPLYTITKAIAKETIPTSLWAGMAVKNKEHVAQIYQNKIMVSSPLVNWLCEPQRITCRESHVRSQRVIDAVLADIADDCPNSAWDRIFTAMTTCGDTK